ncbi:hypothetical protein GIB67_008075 [Kingdonia uniflora]|uniref:Uncharacterized protein n=1 Tax=Kingdonia uniflora TaxID=39325 RepID=A0A7J7MD21_9MAGN|nr:hypothetical protein GIB67_008075 [Kingdonia uniflora]
MEMMTRLKKLGFKFLRSPRAPTSRENKKALENIHGYIANFFYENNISFNCARSDSYSKMMQAIVQYNDRPNDRELWKKMERILDRRWSGMLQKPLHAVAHYLNLQYYYTTLTSSDEMESNTKLKEGLLDCIEKLTLGEEDESQILGDLIVYRTKWSGGSLLEVKSPPCKDLQKEFLGLLARLLLGKGFGIYTKKRNCMEHDRMRDLAYIQYNKRLKKCYEECISRKEIDPIVLKSLDEWMEWLIPDDVRDDIVLGTDITYGVLEDVEDGFDDTPLSRTSRTNTASHCSQGGALSSRSTTRHLQDSSDDDDYDVDANYDMGDGDDDGIDSGSDEDI